VLPQGGVGGGAGDLQDAGGLGDGGALAGHPLQLGRLGRADGAGAANTGDVGLSAQINDTANGGIDPSSDTVQDAPVVFGSTPHLRMTVIASAAPFKVGGTATWVVHVANTGDRRQHRGDHGDPTVTDTGGDFVTWSGSGTGWTCTAIGAGSALEEQRNGEWRYLEFLQVTSLITAGIFMREIPGGTRARHGSRPVDLPEHRY
jgi:hypothetical protein